MNVDTQWVKDNAGVGEALRDVNLLDSEQDCAFMLGAQWHAAGMAVCEFLADLAALVTPRKTFFAYSPDTGFDTYATAHEAEAAACESLAGYAEDAGGTLWDGDVESVCWGEVVEQARQTSRRPVEAGENPEADEIVTYGLLP